MVGRALQGGPLLRSRSAVVFFGNSLDSVVVSSIFLSAFSKTESHSAGIDGGEGASWSGHSDLEKTIAKEGHYAGIGDEEDASWY
jgi:hypothetical protein